MTFEQFLVQALGLIDSLRQRGVIVYYRAGSTSSIGTEATAFIAEATLDEGPTVAINIDTESTAVDYEAALSTLCDALTFAETQERVFARIKDLLSALTIYELRMIRSEAVKLHIDMLISRKLER